MLRKAFVFVIVTQFLLASVNADTTTHKISSTTQITPEIKERFFGLDQILGSIFHGPNHNAYTGPGGFGGNIQQPGSYPIQQNPQQGGLQNMQQPQQSANQNQDFGQQVNFDQYPSQNQGNLNPGNNIWRGQNQNSPTQLNNWQNVQTPQQFPNQGQDFSQQYPSQNQGNLNPGNTPWLGQNSQSQGDWRNVRTPQQFPSQQDSNQQYNSDRYPSQAQDNNNFGPGANQDFNAGTLDGIPSQNGMQQTGYPFMQNQNTGQTGFQNQNPQGNGGNYNLGAVLRKPVVLSSTSAPDRIVFQDASDTPEQIQCVQDCQTTTEYNPVCGSNNITYFNPGRFICARNCGIMVFVDRSGRCF